MTKARIFFSCRMLLFTLLTIVLASSVRAQGQAQPQLPAVKLNINGNSLIAELASTEIQRYMGLSYRSSLSDNSGMLFVYPAEQALTFTMRNTLIPLSIAFISPLPNSPEMIINEIHLMNVGPNQFFPSKQRAQFALEVNQGWFAANGIKAGDKISINWQ